MNEGWKKFTNNLTMAVEPRQRGHRFRAFQATIADHVANHRAVLLFDKGLIVLARVLCLNCNSPVEVTIDMRRQAVQNILAWAETGRPRT